MQRSWPSLLTCVWHEGASQAANCGSGIQGAGGGLSRSGGAGGGEEEGDSDAADEDEGVALGGYRELYIQP